VRCVSSGFILRDERYQKPEVAIDVATVKVNLSFMRASRTISDRLRSLFAALKLQILLSVIDFDYFVLLSDERAGSLVL
jgi:hypothetical protein